MTTDRLAVLGVDPGLTGGLVALDCRTGEAFASARMDDLIRGRGWRPAAIADVGAWLKSVEPPGGWAAVWLEALGRRSGEGVRSTSTAGIGWGALLGLTVGLDLPVSTVSAPTWRALIGLPVATARSRRKATAVAYAEGISGLDLRGPRGGAHTGLADAACIACAAATTVLRGGL